MALISLIFTASAAASGHTVWTWGTNTVGQLGDGSTSLAKTPESVAAGVAGIAGGFSHSLALLSNGRVASWGNNEEGQLGVGSGPGTCGSVSCSVVPDGVSGLSGVVQVAAGGNFSLALLSNGTVMSWGDNDNGQLGVGTSIGPTTCDGFNCSQSPVAVTGLSNVKAIAAGGNHALALLNNGTVMAWGLNNVGQLGTGSNTGPSICSSGQACSPDPVLVRTSTGGTLTHVVAIAAGASFSLALVEFSTSEVFAWGDNRYGQLGQGSVVGPDRCGTEPCSPSPVGVGGLSGTEVAIAANADAFQALALEPNGTVAAWGDNVHDGAGSACGAVCPTPKLVPGVSNAVAIATSGGSATARSMALESGGQVMEWGSTPLGNGTYPGQSATPVPVTGMTSASAIAAGGSQSLALAPPPPSRFGLILFRCKCGYPVLKIHVPYPGVLTVHQPGFPSPGPLVTAAKKSRPLLRPVRLSITRARTVRVRLHLTAAGKRALRHHHKLRIRAKITFVPRGGLAASRTITVTFRRHR